MANTSTQCSTSHNDSIDTDSSTGGRTLSMQYLKDLFKKDWKLYYRTPELNEKLFLHYKGKFNDFNSLGLNKPKLGPHGD
jgi:hypothetical protein